MVSGWIPFDKSLPEKPEVLDISAHTGLTIAEVILSLMRFWSWMDDHSNDGIIRAKSVRILSALCPHVPGTFWDAMVSVGWLEVGEDFVRCVNFEKYISKSAKKRLSESRRKMDNRRNRNSLSEMSASQADKKRTKSGQKSHLPTPTPTPIEDNPLTPFEGVIFPSGFDSAEVKAALARWVSYRKEAKLKALKKVSLQGIVKTWSKEGEAKFTEAVEHSIAQGYHGIYPPGGRGGDRPNSRRGPMVPIDPADL